MPEQAEPHYDLYLLVHPEIFPSNDWKAILGELGEEALEDLPEDFDRAYGAQVCARVTQAKTSVVILDPYDIERLVEDADFADLSGELDGESSARELCCELARRDGGEVLEVTQGAPLRIFSNAVQADAFNVDDAMAQFSPPRAGAELLLGGFHRKDCVQRCRLVLEANGWHVTICHMTTLPLVEESFPYPTSSHGADAAPVR